MIVLCISVVFASPNEKNLPISYSRSNNDLEINKIKNIIDPVLNEVKVFFNEDLSKEEIKELSEEYGIIKYLDINSAVIELNVNVNELAKESNVISIESKKDFVTFNNGTRKSIKINLPQIIFDLTGNGITLAEWDQGLADTTHLDLTGRTNTYDTCSNAWDSGSCSALSHGTHVAGTMVGNGSITAAYKGQAPKANLITWEWPEATSELYSETNTSVAKYSAVISQNSWGYTSCYNGDYDSLSKTYDRIIYGNKTYVDEKLTIVFSAGNEGSQGYNSTCGPGGTAKNTISVGSIDYDTNTVSSFSSRGPTDDGRIKPDVVAPGCGTYSSHKIKSTEPGNTYSEKCGTSMAAPVVSGLLAVMHEAYINTYGNRLLPSTDKAILIQTATDLGNAGPDFLYGWGLIDAKKAVKHILNGSSYIATGNLSQSQTINYTINITESIDKIRATLVWDDPAIQVYANWQLASDLDVWLTAPNGSAHYSWLLDHNNPSNAATKITTLGNADYRNNVEQVEVDNPIIGEWTVSVRAYFVTNGPQEFSLAYYQAFDNSTPTITSVSPANNSSNTDLSYTINASIFDTNSEIVNCTFEFNNINTSMIFEINQNTSCYKDYNFNGKGNRTFKIFTKNYYDNEANEEITFTILNSEPEVNTTPISGNITSEENSILYINTSSYDTNNDSLTYLWLLNDSSIFTSENLSYSINSTQQGFYNLTLIVSDGEVNTSTEWNLTINEQNDAPEIHNSIISVTINETDLFNLSINATDANGDALTYFTNFSLLSQTENNFTWQTNLTSSETYSILFNVSDGTNTTSLIISLKVNELTSFNGNDSELSSNINVNIFVNGTLNESQLTEVNNLNITDSNNNTILDFNWNFSKKNVSFEIDYNSFTGTIIVKNLNISSQNLTKIIYINKSSSSFNYVCILDAEVTSINAFSASCTNSNETKLACPGTSGNYQCSEVNGYFKVSGLSNTAVKGITVSSSYSPNGGSGGGSSDDDEIKKDESCKEDWACGTWEKCIENKQVRRCFELNSCGTTNYIPLIEQECELVIQQPKENETNKSYEVHDNETIPNEDDKENNFFPIQNGIVGIILGVIIFLIIIAIIWRR